MASLRSPRGPTVAGILFVAALGLMIGLRNHYTWHMPQLPDTRSGKTIPIEVDHGKIVYVDAAEQKILYGTYVATGITFIGALVAFSRTQKT
jgi:hypothetical protein